MAKYISQRIIYMVLTLFIIATFTFFLMKIIPGTPFTNASKLSETQLAIMKDKYGLDEPVPSAIYELYGQCTERRFRGFLPV